jgi:predicted ATPase
MRVREMTFRDFRNFRGERRISFVDPLTDQVRPITVIAGTNGTGKTTILDVIETSLRFIRYQGDKDTLTIDRYAELDISTVFELLPTDVTRFSVQRPQQFTITTDISKWTENGWTDSTLRPTLQKSIGQMDSKKRELGGGLLYLPQERRLEVAMAGAIEPPPESTDWIYRWENSEKWLGSLAQFWVWQDYLDLDQQRRERANTSKSESRLKSFINTVEDVLGEGRKIDIVSGIVCVSAPWRENDGSVPMLLLDYLPSGERQILLMFGELARRRRPGAIILIDEPELNLHPTLQVLVMGQLRKIAREWDAQIIVATHSLEILRAVPESSRIYLDHLEVTQPTAPIID